MRVQAYLSLSSVRRIVCAAAEVTACQCLPLLQALNNWMDLRLELKIISHLHNLRISFRFMRNQSQSGGHPTSKNCASALESYFSFFPLSLGVRKVMSGEAELEGGRPAEHRHKRCRSSPKADPAASARLSHGPGPRQLKQSARKRRRKRRKKKFSV